MDSDTTNLLIDRTEGYDIRRYAQTDWPLLKAMLNGIAAREGYPTGVILVEARDEAGSNALHYAAHAGNQELAQRMISEVDTTIPALTSVFVNEANRDGYTPMHVACERGRQEVAKTLNVWDAKHAPVNKNGCPAIALAFCNFHDGLAEYLRPMCLYEGVKPLPPLTS